jgi:alpha-L-fucosidase 2
MNEKNLKSLTIAVVILLALSATLALVYFVLIPRNNASSKLVRVACVGDSITQSSAYPYDLWELLGSRGPFTYENYTQYPTNESMQGGDIRYEVGNFGVGGTFVSLASDKPYINSTVFQSVLKFRPNIIIIMLGTNDAQPSLHPYNASFVGDYKTLIHAFQRLAGKPKIWIVLPPPIFSSQGGKTSPEYFTQTIIPDIKQAANETNLPTINVNSALAGYSDDFPDGIHPNAEGGQLIADTIYNAVGFQNM